MQSIIPLIIIGVLAYLMLSRRGVGMGCCGSHGSHDSAPHQDRKSRDRLSQIRQEDVIELGKDEYTILPSKGDKRPL
jgi:hypothetical protein